MSRSDTTCRAGSSSNTGTIRTDGSSESARTRPTTDGTWSASVSSFDRTGVARAPEFLALVSAQVPAEAEHPTKDVVGLEVGLAAVEVHEPSRNEAPLFVEDEPDAPAPARDGLAAAAALRLRARRALGAVDPREAPVRQARARRALKALPVGRVRGRFHQGLKQRLRPLVGRARRMEPQRHLALRNGVGKALAETQHSTLNGLSAAAALGAAARGGFEEVGHAGNSPR